MVTIFTPETREYTYSDLSAMMRYAVDGLRDYGMTDTATALLARFDATDDKSELLAIVTEAEAEIDATLDAVSLS